MKAIEDHDFGILNRNSSTLIHLFLKSVSNIEFDVWFKQDFLQTDNVKVGRKGLKEGQITSGTSAVPLQQLEIFRRTSKVAMRMFQV